MAHSDDNPTLPLRRRRPILIAGITLAVVCAACGPSPQPIPPPVAISVQAISVSETATGVALTGTAGALSDADALELVHVATGIELLSGSVASDGSFVLDVPGALANDLFRLQGFGLGGPSEPVTFRGQPDTSIAVEPAVGCATALPPFDIELPPGAVGLESTRDLVIRNDCGATLGVDAAQLMDTVGWTVDPIELPFPMDVAPAGIATIHFGYTPAVAGGVSNVVVVDLVGPPTERRIFTLRARGE